MNVQLPEPEALQELISALSRLPGVGKRTARRMAYHLLQNDREGALQLSVSLSSAIHDLLHCCRCNSFTQTEICPTCANPQRNDRQLCVVETAVDMNMIESSHSYRGLYYVLMGRLAPLEGGRMQVENLERLLQRINETSVREVIIATNFTAEGETTAHYITELLRGREIKISRIARGIPSGSELEYVDAGTIAWALNERRDQ